MFNMTNNVIEMKTGENVEQGELNYLAKVGIVAGMGAVKQLAGGGIYVAGIGAGLLFGKKAGFKTVGTIVGVGAVWNAARFVMGEFDK